MLPLSLVVILTGVALGAIALAGFVWAWRLGQFDGFEAQAHAVFDDRDLRLERPWETPEQRAERRRYGGPLEPAPGEWGGAE